MVDGTYDGTMLNTSQTFEVATHKYLVINFDTHMTQHIFDWASEVVERHSDHKVIVTTHMYLDYDGTPLNGADSHAPDKYGIAFTGEGFWGRFLAKHENIMLVLSGHIAYQSIVTSQKVGEHGNTVTQMLINPQNVDVKYKGGLGLVAMLYFSADGKRIQGQYYSTIKDQYFSVANEYERVLE